MRNLGYTKNAGEFVRRFFADIGSAGGHRAMAKAVVPMRAFREKFGELTATRSARKLQELVDEFLHARRRDKDTRKATNEVDAKSEARGSRCHSSG